jgi:hypothetical protein
MLLYRRVSKLAAESLVVCPSHRPLGFGSGDANPALSPEELEVGKSWATLKKAWEAWIKQIDHWDFNGFL